MCFHRYTFPWLCLWEGCITYHSVSSHILWCALGRIHNRLKVVFCFMHATPSHNIHHVDLLTCIEHIRGQNPATRENACWIYSVGSVSKMYLILSVTFLIFFAIWGVICVELAHSSLGDQEDIFITHLVIIFKSKVSAFPIVVIFSVAVCLRLVVVLSYAVSFMCIYPGTAGFVSFIAVQSYGVRKKIKYIMAWWSHSFVCTLHYLIIIIMQTYLKVLNF